MQINNKLFIKRYNHGNSAEFKKEKNELSKKFEILNDQTFQNDKNIYILQKQRRFFEPEIIGYAIIGNFSNLPREEKEIVASIFKVNIETFINHNGWFFQDFMISRRHRRQGYATYFFKSLREQFHNDCGLLLCADGDGLNFWDKVGFVNVDRVTSTMVLKDN